ncbi:hypothetical protein RhiirA4_470855 [Rhizophagus irregularis]|uniref:Uncharacterized protein n=1 Tax=Rhizophagus irregularis TaxID=588596 RepID=A0A2I1H264_9GLOM|nr:hypothetical protein RhiirA4_470855 [Rhizophagus irregularis]
MDGRKKFGTRCKEVVEEFTNLNKDFSEKLPLKPLVTTKPKEDNLSSDDSDETRDSNKKSVKEKSDNEG